MTTLDGKNAATKPAAQAQARLDQAGEENGE